MSMDTLTGGCLYGSARYRTGPPTLPATVCYCRSCRLAAGANAVGLYTVERTSVVLTQGRPVEYEQSIRRQTGRRIDRAIIVVLAVALSYFVVDKIWLSKRMGMDGKPEAGTSCATVAKVEVSKSGQLKILQIDVAFDAGRVMNRDAVATQIEGGTLFALNMSLCARQNRLADTW
jgi:CO/xanthine dehydrogenase Mo-binding subunit